MGPESGRLVTDTVHIKGIQAYFALRWHSNLHSEAVIVQRPGVRQLIFRMLSIQEAEGDIAQREPQAIP